MLETVLSRLAHDPVSVYLLAGDILATIAIGFGIIWEHGPPDVRVVANRLVIGGVIVETICSALLFVYDANIIGDQNDQIIALERRLAPRVITKSQEPALVAALKLFAGTEFDAATDVHDNEQMHLLAALMGVLKEAGWKQVPWQYAGGGITYNFGQGANASPSFGDVASYDVELQVRREVYPKLKPAAEAIGYGLRNIGIAAHAVESDAATVNNANINALHVIVGQKQ